MEKPPTRVRSYFFFVFLKKTGVDVVVLLCVFRELIQAQIINCPRDAVLLEAKFKQHNMNAVAKGIVNNQVRLYLYGQENPSDEFVFVELLINLNTNSLNARVKSTDDSLAKRFVPTLKDILFKVIQ